MVIPQTGAIPPGWVATCRLAALGLAVWVVAAPGLARCQTEGFRLSRTAPGPGVGDGLTGVAPGGPGTLGWSAQLWTGYTRGSLQGVDIDNRTVDIVRDQLEVRLSGALAITPGLRLLADLPVTLLQTGDATRFTPPLSTALGDSSLGVAWFAAGRPAHGAQLGLSAAVVLPTGSTRALSGDGSVAARAETQAAFQTRRLRAVVALGAHYRPTRHYGNATVGTELIARGGVSVPWNRRLSLLAELVAASSARELLAEGHTSIELLAGTRWKIGGAAFASVALGAGLTQAPGTPMFRALFGLGWDTTGPASDPAPRSIDPQREIVSELDRDRDAIPDSRDACPDVAEDMDGFSDADGCPDSDNDGDGVADERDECPDEPETFNQYRDADGCPDWEPSGIQTGPLDSMAPITVSRRGAVDRAGNASLDQLAQLLRENPRITKLTIEGHAQSAAGAPRARALSEQAAQQVRRQLVRRGVDEARLDVAALGDDSATSQIGRAHV